MHLKFADAICKCNCKMQFPDVNCFDRLKFLAEISTNLEKMHPFRQFEGNNSEIELRN